MISLRWANLTSSLGPPLSSSASRRPPRTRRSLISRAMDDEDELRPAVSNRQPVTSSADSEDPMLRQMQLFRGSVTSKMVASKSTLRSLLKVCVDDLPETERSKLSHTPSLYGPIRRNMVLMPTKLASFAIMILALRRQKAIPRSLFVSQNADMFLEITVLSSGSRIPTAVHIVETRCTLSLGYGVHLPGRSSTC